MQKCILAQHFCLCIMMYGDGNMQLSGYAISAFGTIVILFFYYERLLQRRAVSIKTLFTAFLFAAILLTVQTQLAYDVNINTFTNIATMFALSFFYFGTWYLRLFVSFAFYVVTVLSEGSAVLIGRLLFAVDTIKINESLYFIVISFFSVIYNFLYNLVITYIICLFKQHKQKLQFFILFLIAVLIYSIIILLVTFADTAYQIPSLILCMLLIGAIAGCLYLFNDQLRAQREHLQRQHLEAMLQDQLEHYAALYQTNQQLAGLRHDLKNILINVRSYIQLKEYEKLDAYMEQLQEQIQPASLVDNGLPFIDAVLTAKVAGHEEIDFSWHIDPLNLKYIQQSQLAMVLAIALDNALDACAVSRDPFIDIRIAQQGDLISLVVTNAADHPVKSIGSKLLSTKPDKQGHGYGMQSMEHIAAQNHGTLLWNYENRQFRLSVLLQDQPADGD